VAKKEKVECQYCGKEYSPRGIKTHENACSENPENKEEFIIVNDEEEEEKSEEKKDFDLVSKETKEAVEEEEDDVEIDSSANNSQPSRVTVKLRQDFRCNIGGMWYDFKEDKRYTVSPDVKRILSEKDLLKPL
jgi:hypothetical protein